MNDGTWDLVVIGGGVAGVTAALEAAQAGARVVLVRAGPGATALASGAWHGPLPPLLADALAAAGLPYRATRGLLPHPHGELRAAAFAGASHVGGAPGEGTLVVGVAGLPGFPAGALARSWGGREGIRLDLDGTPAAGWSPVSLAARLERAPGDLLERLSKLGAVEQVILPAVLGLERHAEFRAELSALPFEVVEALGTTPSVPGWRLDRALLRALEAAGVPVRQGRVVAHAEREDRLESVTVAGTGGEAVLAAEHFVLATGRFIGGGIGAAEGTAALDVARGGALRGARLVERTLGCDVWVDHLGDRFELVQPVPLTTPERDGAQPLLGAGVHTDERGRPVAGGGRVRYANVVARGAVVAGRPHGLGFAAGSAP